MNFHIIAMLAAAAPTASWDEIGRVAIPLAAIVVFIGGLIATMVKVKGWIDKNYLTRLEFEQFVTDLARFQKVERRKKHERPD